MIPEAGGRGDTVVPEAVAPEAVVDDVGVRRSCAAEGTSVALSAVELLDEELLLRFRAVVCLCTVTVLVAVVGGPVVPGWWSLAGLCEAAVACTS